MRAQLDTTDMELHAVHARRVTGTQCRPVHVQQAVAQTWCSARAMWDTMVQARCARLARLVIRTQ